MRSLRKRLTLGVVFILLLVFIGQWATLHYAIGKVAKDQVVKHLEHDGTTLLQATEIAPDGVITINEFFVEEVYRRPGSGHYLVVFLDGKQVYASPSLGGQTLETAAVPPGARKSSESTGPNGQPVLALMQGHRLQGHEVSITAAEDLDVVNEEINRESLSSLWLILPLLIGTALLVGFTIRSELKPLSGVQNQLRGIRLGDVGRIQGEVPVEIRPLVDEVNRLLELMQRRLQQSRTGVGNLAHAIKTPLAVLFRLADEPLLPPEQRVALKTQSTAIRDRVELELKRARLAGASRAGAHTNVRAELEDMIKVLSSIYREKNLEITYEAPEQPLPYDREDMLELLGNLADNACKWAKRRVLIKVGAGEHGGLHLYVADDGPGCTEQMVTVIKQRGVRLDESTPGHGLGLAICKDIVQFYGGTMNIGRDRIMNGLSIRIELPERK
jgi:signal transduction histidine kinase